MRVALATDGLEDKQALLQAHPEHLFTIPHFDNYAAVLLRLDNAYEKGLRESLTVDRDAPGRWRRTMGSAHRTQPDVAKKSTFPCRQDHRRDAFAGACCSS